MKTAMQELINDLKNTKISAEESLNELENEYIRGIANQFSQGILDAVIEGIESEYLQKEKEQIMNAVTYGNRMEFYDGSEMAGSQYYNETFNSHE